jgi:predicted glycosyltransferase
VKVWIDLSNSPHPLLFAPVARRLEEHGHTVAVTARDNAQTVELARQRWSAVAVIGGESPSGRTSKAAAVAARARALARWAHANQPDIAVSHNSYAQIAAARLAHVPAITAMDFEHQPANHLAFRLAATILVPDVMPRASLARCGASSSKVRPYAGLKEEIYLGDFEPDAEVLRHNEIEARKGDIVVVVRTPPSRALYHRFENPLFTRVLETLGRQHRVRAVALVRYPEQRAAIAELHLENVVVLRSAVDSRSLTYAADLVIGAGGTMTREAALMGVPTLSAFAGRQPAVDRALEAAGRLRRLESTDQVAHVAPRPQPPEPVERLRERGDRILNTFVQTIEQAAA